MIKSNEKHVESKKGNSEFMKKKKKKKKSSLSKHNTLSVIGNQNRTPVKQDFWQPQVFKGWRQHYVLKHWFMNEKTSRLSWVCSVSVFRDMRQTAAATPQWKLHFNLGQTCSEFWHHSSHHFLGDTIRKYNVTMSRWLSPKSPICYIVHYIYAILFDCPNSECVFYPLCTTGGLQ